MSLKPLKIVVPPHFLPLSIFRIFKFVYHRFVSHNFYKKSHVTPGKKKALKAHEFKSHFVYSFLM